MSAPKKEQTDYDEEFSKAVAEWRDKHRLREDDAVTFLVELFRIHQRHWDELRRREMPAFGEFRTGIGKLAEADRTFQAESSSMLEAMRNQPADEKLIRPRTDLPLH